MLVQRREIFGSDPGEALAVLRWAQQAAGLSDPALGQRMGVRATSVQAYREGKRLKRPGWVFCVRWLRACGFRLVVDADGR